MERKRQKMTIGEIITSLFAVAIFLGCTWSIIVGLADYEYRAGSIHEPVGHYSQAIGVIQEKPPMTPK